MSFEADKNKQRFATRVIHGGQHPDPLTGAVMTPIYATSTYAQTSPGVHKALNLRGAGSYLRKSEMTDPELLAKYPFLPVIATSFEHGDGDFRPRIPQYPELQDLIGGAINAVLVGQAEPKTAMDDIQSKAEALFK